MPSEASLVMANMKCDPLPPPPHQHAPHHYHLGQCGDLVCSGDNDSQLLLLPRDLFILYFAGLFVVEHEGNILLVCDQLKNDASKGGASIFAKLRQRRMLLFPQKSGATLILKDFLEKR